MHDYVIEITEGSSSAVVTTAAIEVADVSTEVAVLEVSVEGPQGIPGPPGPAGPSGGTWAHHQINAAAQWTVTHNLGVPTGPVILLDSDPTVQVYTHLDHIDENTVMITFPSPVTGWAYF